MSLVRYVPKRRRWLFDGTNAAGRDQRYFSSEEEALRYKDDFDAALKGYVRVDQANVSAPRHAKKSDEVIECTIGAAVNKYLANVSRVEKSERTQKQDKIYLTKFYDYMYDVLKLGFVHEIEPEHVEQYRAHLKQDLAPSTVNRELQSVNPFLKRCKRWKFTTTELHVERLTEPPPKARAWTKEQYEAFDAALDLWAADVLKAMDLTGLRPVQIGALRFRDVDMDGNRYFTTEKKGGVWRETWRPCDPEFVVLVRKKFESARRNFKARPDDLVFLNSKGRPVNSGNLGQAIRKVRDELGLPELTAYGMRHKFGTDLNDAGVNLRTISALIGHSKTTVTERYTQPRDEGLRDAIAVRSNVRKIEKRPPKESVG